MTTNDLIGNFDAQAWASAWLETLAEHPEIATDEGTMQGWFANAIMSGYDHGVRQERQRSFDDRVREIAYQAAGAGAGAVMREAPEVVMPDGDIVESVTAILDSFGVADEQPKPS